MRIHGDIKLIRRNDIEQRNDYSRYREEIREDFKAVCGYCGKSECVTTKGFEIDHFVPRKVDENKVNEYSNLVYCCFTCNRKKMGKWPTCNKNVPNDGTRGFVDPASEEYDLHIGRNDDGNIVYYTDVGKYMCIDAFKFNIRPMKEIWLYMELVKRKKVLRNLMTLLTEEDCRDYMEIDFQIEELQKYLFNMRE